MRIIVLSVVAALMMPAGPIHAQVVAEPVRPAITDAELSRIREAVFEAMESGEAEELARATELELKALGEFTRRGSLRAASVSHLNLAAMYTLRERFDSAAIHIERGDSIARELGEPGRSAWFDIQRGARARAMGDTRQALSFYCAVLPALRRSNDGFRVEVVERAIAELGTCGG